MQFAQPLWLIAGLAACALLFWLYRRFDRVQRDALAQFAAVRLHDKLTSSVSAPRRRVKRALFTGGMLLLFVALARPQSGFEWQETHRKGLELLFAVDTSKSMLAQDIKPDRLTRAKLGVHDLVTKLNGDGVGLIAFAGSAFLQCPVTLDYDAFRESLSALDTSVIPHGGTNIAAAIREAEAVFKTRSTAEKILVLVTDGEDLDGEGITAAERVAKDGVKIFTVGVGSSTGELVPVPDENGGIEFAKDENGQLIKSHLDETTLKKIAEVTGGMYQPLGAQAEGLAKIYDEGLAQFTREDLSSRQAKVPLEKFYWPLLGALLCLLGEMLIGNRRSTKAAKPAPAAVKSAPRPALRHAAVALLCIGGFDSAQAATAQSAEQAYAQGDFARAQQEYADTAAQQPGNAPLHFNAGSAAYKAGDYAQAASGFQASLKTDQVALQHDAYYNLGNTQYRVGQQTAKEKPEETIKTWEEAVKSYDAALQIAANDTEAKHNRDFVQRKLEELKKQQEQKKQDQQKQDQQQNQDQKNESKDQQQESKDSKGGGQGQQQQDSKDQSKDSKENKDQSKDSKGGKDEPKDAKDQQAGAESKPDEAKPDEGKDSKGGKQQQPEAGKDQQAGAKPEESKDSKADASPQPAADQQEQQQADAQAGKGDPPKPVNAEKKPEQGKIEAANGDKQNDAQAAAAAAEEERREPGQMTKAEARQLLDALKGDERQVPMISAQGRAAAQPNEHKTRKDW